MSMSPKDIMQQRTGETLDQAPDRPTTLATGWYGFSIVKSEYRPNERDLETHIEHPEWNFLLRHRFSLNIQIIKADGSKGMFVRGRRGGNIEISPVQGTDRDGKARAYADREYKLWKTFVALMDPEHVNTAQDFGIEILNNGRIAFEGRFVERAMNREAEEGQQYRVISGESANEKRAEYAAEGYDIYNTLEDVRFPKE